MELLTEERAVIFNGRISQKMDNGQEIGLLPTLNEICILKSNTKVAFAVAKNIRKLSSAQETRNKVREAILVSHSRKDDGGKPVMDNDIYQFEDSDAFSTCMLAIQELDAMDSGVEIHHITEADILSIEGITAHQILILGDLIIEQL